MQPLKCTPLHSSSVEHPASSADSRVEGDQLVRNSIILSAFLAVASYVPLIAQLIQLLCLSTAPLVMIQRKNLIDLGHDLGNLDQDLMHPDQDSRFLAMMSKILPKKILNNFKIGLKIIHSDSKLRDCVKTDKIFFTKIKRHTQKE